MNNKKRLVHIAILASIVCVLAVFSAPQNDAYAASKKPSNTSITRISKTNKSITVKLAKSKLAKGYQVKVSTTKKFTSAKTKTVSNSTYKNNGKMVSVRALKKKTKYFL